MENIRRPNLFLVGQPKSGTTALYNFLKQHPDVFACRVKEPDFFCKDFILESDRYHGQQSFYLHKWSRNISDYLSLFCGAKSESIIAESSTSYLYSSVAADEIYKFNPGAKIIILLREPISFLYSLYVQRSLTAGENVEDFGTSVSLEKSRRLGQCIPTMIKYPSALLYSERVKYAEQIVRYFDLFGTSNVKVIIFETFKEHNEVVYDEVLRFLGISVHVAIKFGQHNVSKMPRFVSLNKILKNSISIRKIKSLIPWAVLKKITPQINRILLKQAPYEALDSQLRSKLITDYRPEVENVSRLLDIDLVKMWGYDQI